MQQRYMELQEMDLSEEEDGNEGEVVCRCTAHLLKKYAKLLQDLSLRLTSHERLSFGRADSSSWRGQIERTRKPLDDSWASIGMLDA
jgi:hypothetical protein